jgi:hypothetical protein
MIAGSSWGGADYHRDAINIILCSILRLSYPKMLTIYELF